MKKTLSFAVIHFSIASLVAYALTGDILLSSLIAMTEPAVNTVAFYFHEKAWLRKPANPKLKTASFAVVHFSVAFTVAWLISGNPLVGGIMAMLEPTINTFAYYWHEKGWQLLHKSAHSPLAHS